MKQKLTKRCPRCNTELPIGVSVCYDCGLNFDKFKNATNAEAKKALRAGEKDRVLNSRILPSDVSKTKLLLACIFGGLFGAHEFMVGRWLKGLIYTLLTVVSLSLSALEVFGGLESLAMQYATEIIYTAWAIVFLIWLDDLIRIIFNRYKVPVSLPYKD